MLTTYYQTTFLASLALATLYLLMWHKHFDVHITLIFVLVPVANLGYALLGSSQTLEEALTAVKITYIGGCYLGLIMMLAVFSLCHIKFSRWERAALLVLSTVLYLDVLKIGSSTSFYRNVSIVRDADGTRLLKEYGPTHSLFIAVVFAYLCVGIFAIVHIYRHNKQVSRKTIQLLFFSEFIAMLSFLGSHTVVRDIDLVPFAYVAALLINLLIVWRISLYDVTDVAIDSLVQTGETGFASFDFKYRYLGSNETAKRVFPQLCELTVDRPVPTDSPLAQTALGWLKGFAAGTLQDDVLFDQDDHTYRIKVRHLYTGKYKRGYQLFIVDETDVQRYIHLLDNFNTELQEEVERKTTHIVEMHDNLVMGMATMVESRDNSTGGHIRRTSEGVRLLVEQLRALGGIELSDSFCHNVIKAAPMHDLGKIAVDDAILRKPGRFTPEEFEQMKAHASEGARIVAEILRGTDDEEFKIIAENVAHYHHERWDGTGYPEGLAREEIPLEARIMAIADVYDALVSKRVYKDALSFERADAIIREGMGSQFDAQLEGAYLAARPQLEEFYRSL